MYLSLSLSLTQNRKHWEGKNSIKFPDQVRNFAVLCQFYYIVIICPFLNAEKQEFTFNFLCYIHIEFMHCEIFSALSQWKWFFIALRERKLNFLRTPIIIDLTRELRLASKNVSRHFTHSPLKCLKMSWRRKIT